MLAALEDALVDKILSCVRVRLQGSCDEMKFCGLTSCPLVGKACRCIFAMMNHKFAIAVHEFVTLIFSAICMLPE